MPQNGGEGGIRTHGRLSPTLVFKTSAFDHSATSPFACLLVRRPIALTGGAILPVLQQELNSLCLLISQNIRFLSLIRELVRSSAVEFGLDTIRS